MEAAPYRVPQAPLEPFSAQWRTDVDFGFDQGAEKGDGLHKASELSIVSTALTPEDEERTWTVSDAKDSDSTEEQETDAGDHFPWRGRLRTSDSISGDFAYFCIRSSSSSSSSAGSEVDDLWDPNGTGRTLSILSITEDDSKDRTVSVLSIPEEIPSASSQASEICRASSKTRFPLDLDCRAEDDYDPCDSRNIAPVSQQQAIDEEVRLLNLQIRKLENMVRRREASEPGSEVLKSYRRNLSDMQEQVRRLQESRSPSGCCGSIEDGDAFAYV